MAGTGHQRRTTTGLVALVGDRDTTDAMMGMTFDDGAVVVSLLRATAGIADPRHWKATNLEMGGADAGDLATVGSRVA